MTQASGSGAMGVVVTLGELIAAISKSVNAWWNRKERVSGDFFKGAVGEIWISVSSSLKRNLCFGNV